MAPNKRADRMIALLQAEGAMSIGRLAKYFDVSEMTIRRDLKQLTASKDINMINGIAFSKKNELNSYSLEQQLGVHSDKKDAIGRAAVELIRPKDAIFIDCGSTASAVVSHLPLRSDNTVICSTLNVLTGLQRKQLTNLIFTGGYYHPDTQTFESEESLRLMNKVRCAIAFITASGVSRELGLTCMNHYEIAIKRAAMQTALRTVLLVDSSKFGKASPAFFSAWDGIDTIITNDDIPQSWIDFLNEMKIELIIATR